MSAPTDALVLERVLPARPEEVFAAWTTPERMAAWMSPVGHAEADIDLRVGGLFRVVMVDGDNRIEHRGEYLELDPPRRLVFTWKSPYTGPEPSVVTVEFHPDDAGTRMVLTHEHLPVEAVQSHAGGWTSMLERLPAVLARKEHSR